MIRLAALALFGLAAIAGLQSGLMLVANSADPSSTRASAAQDPGDPVIVAAGDIACDPTNSNFNGGLGSSSSCRMKYTADLIGPETAAVLLLGDNQYYCGGLEAFQQSYDLSWGRVKSITRPAVGNHEYLTSGGTGCTSANSRAEGYFNYFGSAAGEIGKGYYSFDVGAWHLIALNSQCGAAGGCGASSPQGQWLAADLAAHPSMCTLAYWHIPLFSSGGRESPNSRPFWDQLYAAGVDVILTSHDHLYERFGKQDPNGNADAQRGIRQWVVGSGGANHTSFTSTIFPNSEVRDDRTFGVLKLTLHPTSYDWAFVPEAGGTFTDSGTTACHGTGSDAFPPSAPSNLTATATGPGRVNLAWGASTDNAGISGYRVSRDGSILATVGGTTTAYADTTATPGATHTYTVVAFDTGGNPSQASNTASATTPLDTTPPAPPGGLTASAPGSTVVLAWTASTDDVGVASYEVVRDGLMLGTVLAPGFTDATVAPLTAYTYAVRARDASGNVSSPGTVSITTPAAPTSLTFAPTDDTYVQADAPTSNFGGSTQVVVDSSPQRRGLLRFAVSGVNGRQVLSARLRLACVDGSNLGGTFHRVVSSSWSEGTVTWNTQPAFDAGALASLGAVTPGVTYEVDLTSLVTGDGIYSLGFQSTSTNGAYYASKEGAAAPQLVLTLAGVPSGDSVKPSAPANLVATAASATRVDLAWGASSDNVGVTGYEVRRGGVPLATVGTTSYADTTVSASTAYSYTVVAKDAAGNASDPSNTASVTTPAATDSVKPSAPANLVATAMSATRVDLAWSASSDNVGVTGYEVRRGGVLLGTVGTTSYADTTVSANTAYTYTVVAKDAAGNASAPSNTANVTTPAATDSVKPSAPANLVATATSATRVDLAWGASTDNLGVTGYEVRRGGVLLATVGTTSYADTTVSASTAYSYTVAAKDAAGNASDPSNIASVTTPAPPATLTFVPVADAAVDDSAPTVNAGTNVALRVDASPLRRAYIRFTVSGVSGPVKKATLRLYANSASTAGYRVGPVASNTWSETTLTASNAPPIGAAVATSSAHGAGIIVEVDVTSLITGNGTYTLGVTTSSSTQINYGSRESSTPPTLVLTLG